MEERLDPSITKILSIKNPVLSPNALIAFFKTPSVNGVCLLKRGTITLEKNSSIKTEKPAITNKEYNQKKLIKLKRMEPSLYEIIERFDQNWDNSIEFDLVTPFKKFDSELENWIKK